MKISKVFKLVCYILIIQVLLSSCAYKGELVGINDGNHVYHRDNCQFVTKSNNDLIILFKDLESTALHAYRPCKTCKPPNNEEYVNIAIENLQNQIHNLKAEKLTIYNKYKDDSVMLRANLEKYNIELIKLNAQLNKIKETFNK